VSAKLDIGLLCKLDELSCEHPDLVIHVQQDHAAIFISHADLEADTGSHSRTGVDWRSCRLAPGLKAVLQSQPLCLMK